MHLPNEISNSSDTQRLDINMIHIAEHLIRSCMDFEASTFFKWKLPRTERRLRATPNQDDTQISYTTAFADSIGSLYLKVIDCYNQLQKGLGSLSLDATVFYRTTGHATKLLVEMDDIIGEIGMIRRIQTSQAGAAKTLSTAIWGNLSQLRYLPRDDEDPSEQREVLEAQDERVEKRRKREELYTLAAIRPLLESFSLLEADAVRVRSMLTTLLDLRHREAAIENVLSGKSQSTMLFIFTTITVLFAPLSFVSSLLALEIEDLPGIWRRSPLAAVFVYATLATMALCTLMWLIYKLVAYQVALCRNELPPTSMDGQISKADERGQGAARRANRFPGNGRRLRVTPGRG
ncbi:uncharacterized protein B0H64DRAFT_82546 [Chaetomium fimeti]|uniref:Uncharacterized protein n=1 Tax=Chaetomium fimeti TaxID=1854472 RepID=A0AAE0HLK5_9PEZI|nr:hypothetical protein B0H64DRAFT_82546 [Chaetomium fimeti]